MRNDETSRLVVHLDRFALDIEELVSEDICRATRNRLERHPHPCVGDTVVPHSGVCLVVVDLDSVVDTETHVVAIHVVAPGTTSEGLYRHAVAEVLNGVVTHDIACPAQVDAAFARDPGARPRCPANDDVVAHRLVHFVRCVTPVENAVVNVGDFVVSHDDVLCVLKIDSPPPIADREILDDDPAQRPAGIADGYNTTVGSSALDDCLPAGWSAENDRIGRGPRALDRERFVGAGGYLEHVTRFGDVGRSLDAPIRVAYGAGAAPGSGNDKFHRGGRRGLGH